MSKYLVFLFIVLNINANAQIEDKKWMAGAGFGFRFRTGLDKTDKEKSIYSNTNISISRSFKKNKFIGLEVGYGSEKHISANKLQRTSKDYTISIFYRQYFPIFNKTYFFYNAALGYSYNRNESSFSSTGLIKEDYHYYSLNVNPGITYNVYKNFHLELMMMNAFSITYQINRQIQNSITSPASKELFIYSSFQDNFLLNTKFSIRYYF